MCFATLQPRPPQPRALSLIASAVELHRAEPLRLLAEVGARDTSAGHVGPHFADLLASLGPTLPHHRCDAHHMFL